MFGLYSCSVLHRHIFPFFVPMYKLTMIKDVIMRQLLCYNFIYYFILSWPQKKKKNLGFIITHLLYTVTIFIILTLFEMMKRNLPKIVFTVTPILQTTEL